MKRLIYILSVLAALVTFAACEKSGPDSNDGAVSVDSKVTGEWKLTEMMVENQIIEDTPSVYLCIKADGTFELYQKSGTQSVRYNKFTGTCHTSDGLLSGEYSTGEPWASSWEYEFIPKGMQLKSFNLLETGIYERVEIPADVRNNADEVTVKSACDTCTPIL